LELPVLVPTRLIVLLLIGLVASGCDRQKAEAPQAPAADAGADAASSKDVDRSHKGSAAPDTLFKTPDGTDTSIAKLGGKPLLVNLWATWCAPCVKELPTLDALEAAQQGKLAVIAVSQDMGPQGSVNAFLDTKKIGRFAAYHDPEMALSSALGVQVLPTSILYDATGKEVWRYTGDLDWMGGEARKLLAEAH
jgi:thiol-disulfide isomerase/thioredoxin